MAMFYECIIKMMTLIYVVVIGNVKHATVTRTKQQHYIVVGGILFNHIYSSLLKSLLKYLRGK